ncbi:cytochrome c oxidase subunit I [Lutibaculum baratangense]|uniref:cytochrome-c oxidase n=1 Tax=Lutibaculum baratangense AMV1 TaxID=631454 RepID=V4RCY4_9HYPH|nr:cytochrome c oxidase subunit I [Lutibaculum baratangense]ESR23259.1 Cytochrome c oxidase polypeptide I [Lutibaculum baratangense AMV1]
MKSETEAVERHARLSKVFGTPPGLGQLSAVNHTTVGLRFIVASLFFFVVAGILSMLIRAQLATATNDFIGPDIYNQIFTAHGTLMMFLFAIPLIEGFTLYLLPKLLGSRDLAFPRLSAYGFWCYLFGGSIVLLAVLLGHGPDSGWFMYTPLSSEPYSPGIRSDIWLLGITFVEISAISIGVEIVVTILKVRTAGMKLIWMPLFGWYLLVTAFMIIAGFPPLILGSILLELERAFGLPFFDPARGGDSILWQHLFWLFGHPEVYIIFLPGAALISTMVPPLARHPIIGYTMIVAAIVATGVISFGLWVHHMYTVGIPHLGLAFFSAASMLVAVPTGVQFFAWIATLFAGRPAMKLPMLYLFGFLIVFVMGGLTGVMVALVPFDWQVHDTHFVVAHMHYVLVGGLVFPMLAAAYYWLPHVSGRAPSGKLGVYAFWFIFIGFNLTFFIMHLTGLRGMPRRVYTYEAGLGWDIPNLVSSVGGFILSIGFAMFLMDMLIYWRLGRLSPRNPWKADTLDWAMPIPSPTYNFGSQPEITGPNPLWNQPDLGREIAAGKHYLGEVRNGWRETLAVDVVSGRPHYIILLPGPTYLPLIAGLTTAIFFASFLLKVYWMAAVGAGLSLCVYLAWAWANGAKTDPVPVAASPKGDLLPTHTGLPQAPGWWGLVFTLVADAHLFASLIFGFIYLKTIAPNWPPPFVLEVSPLLPALAIGGCLVGYLGARAARLANEAGREGMRAIGLVVSYFGGFAAAAAFVAIPWVGLEDLTAHAYAAGIAALAGYGALHALVGGIISAFVATRCAWGYVSPVRSLETRIASLWWGYTAVAAVIIGIAMFIVPAVLPS